VTRISKFVVFVCLVFCFWGVSLAELQGEAGYVSAVRGDVYAVSRDGVARTLRVKSRIFVGEHIITEAGGRVNIVFRDDSVLSLGQGSHGKLTKYGWSEISQRGEFELKVEEGVFRVIGAKLTKTSPERFRTLTPAATIGIRGSAYAGRVFGNQLEVVMTSGKGIDVSNESGRVALLLPGMGTQVVAGTAPLSPRLYSSEELVDLLSELEESADPHHRKNGGGSEVSATIINRAKIKNSTNLAAGRGNRANMGSVQIKNSDVSGVLINEADVSNSANVAVGSDNEASTGSIVIE